MTKYLSFLAWLVFRSQGLITYYIIDNYFVDLKKFWIVYFIIASSLIYLAEQIRQPLIPYIYKKIRLWLEL